jgi:hypothetical protein
MNIAANSSYQLISVMGVVSFGGVRTGPAGVRENRGAGAACSTPWADVTVERARRCSFRAASAQVSTGVTHASVPREDGGPRVAGPAREPVGEDRAHLGVRPVVELVGHLVGRQAEAVEQLREELRFDRADGHVLAVGCLVRAVERCAAVE